MGDERLRAVVRGEVQGVGFRWAVQRRARELGLVGYAANAYDGSVVVEAEGPGAALDELEAFLRRGPRYAEVHSVAAERNAATGAFRGFETR